MKVLIVLGTVLFLFANCRSLNQKSDKSNIDCPILKAIYNMKSQLSEPSHNIDCPILKAIYNRDSSLRYVDSMDAFELLNMLNRSKSTEALQFIKSHFKFQDVLYNGHRGFKVDSLDSSFWDAYAAYRLSSYFDQLDYGALERILIANYNSPNASEPDCEKQLTEIESKYLSFFYDKPEGSTIESITDFRIYVSQFPNSSRIKYLWADLLFHFGSVDSALILFKNLNHSGYYQLPILRKLIDYYRVRDSDSLNFYISELTRLDSSACNIGKISVALNNKNLESVQKECKKCLSGEWGVTDSIKANLYLAIFYLQKKEFSQVYSAYNNFQAANQESVFDTLKIREKREMDDIYLRAMFLEKKYQALKLFAANNLYEVENINIRSKKGFRKLIENYYVQYFDNFKESDFDVFYNTNFR